MIVKRNFFLALFVFACIVGPGALLFRGSEGAVFLVEIVGFTACFALFNVLENRDRRRRQRRDHPTG
jgi:hypothetical protein